MESATEMLSPELEVPGVSVQDLDARYDAMQSRLAHLQIVYGAMESDPAILAEIESEVMQVINELDGLFQIDQPKQKKMFRLLRRTCGWIGLLPASHMLSEGLSKTSDHPQRSGGFADVWLGKLGERPVAIKALRIYAKDDMKRVKKRFCSEVVLWKRLKHPNVLPFLGVSTTLFQFCMVSDWIPHGNVVEFLRENPEANRFSLLADVTSGLHYLHGIDFIHGDLKGPNILVDVSGHALLADFGVMTIMSDPLTVNPSTTLTHIGTTRWTAPELFDPEEFGLKNGNPTKRSDVYALGMVIFEILTGNFPFVEFRDYAIIKKVMEGMRPNKPTHVEISIATWKMMQHCWQARPLDRPNVSQVLDFVLEPTDHWPPIRRPMPELFVHKALEDGADSESLAGYSESNLSTSHISITTDVLEPPSTPQENEGKIAREYMLNLYHEFDTSFSIPLWSPSPVSLGAVGYLSEPDGGFVTLFNAFDGHEDIESLYYYGSVPQCTKEEGGFQMYYRFSHQLHAGQIASILCVQWARHNYLGSFELPMVWFRENHGKIFQEFCEKLIPITREEICLVVGTLDAPHYAMFVSGDHEDGQVHFDTFKERIPHKRRQPWGKFSIETTGGVSVPLNFARNSGEVHQAEKVSNFEVDFGSKWNSVLLAGLRVAPQPLAPTAI